MWAVAGDRRFASSSGDQERRDVAKTAKGKRGARSVGATSAAAELNTASPARGWIIESEEVAAERVAAFPEERVVDFDFGDGAGAGGWDAVVAPRDAGAERLETRTPDDEDGEARMSSRRFLMASVCGLVVAETAGQVVERTMMSETSRLRLHQRMAIEHESVMAFAETDQTITDVGIVEMAARELKRAGAISALAALGAVGSQLVSQQKKKMASSSDEEESKELKESPRPQESASASPFLTTDANGARDEAAAASSIPACLTGATCPPDWIDDDWVDASGGYGEPSPSRHVVPRPLPAAAAATAADSLRRSSLPIDASGALANASTDAPRDHESSSSPWWRLRDADNVAKTVVFSTCYGGFFQPHWFNVLNSYEWADIILPTELDLQLRALSDQLLQGQTIPGAPAEGASFVLRQLFQYAGGYSDPSLVAAVSLSLAAPIEAAGSFLAPLAVNQLLAIPLLYWPGFFIFTGMAEGKSLAVVMQTLHRRLPTLMKANLAFWIPAQGFQFSSVPVEDQAVYVAVMGVLWNGVLAAMMTPDSSNVIADGNVDDDAGRTHFADAAAAPDCLPIADASTETDAAPSHLYLPDEDDEDAVAAAVGASRVDVRRNNSVSRCR